MWKNVFWGLLALCLPAPALTAQSGVPAWYLDREGQYPRARYISATGEGRSRADAEASAVAGVSLFFNTKTEVRNQAIREFNEAASGTATEFSRKTYISESAIIRSEEEFLGIRFAAPWQNPRDQSWAALAYIDRQEAAKIYEAKINANMTALSALFADANAETEALYACGLLYRALHIGTLTEEYVKTAVAVDPAAGDRYAPLLRQIQELRSAYRSRREGLSIAVPRSGGGLAGRVEIKLGELLEGAGFVITEGDTGCVLRLRLSAPEETSDAGIFVRCGLAIGIEREGRTLFSYSKNYPRYGHRTLEGAYNRAFMAIEADLGEHFIAKLTAMLGR